jgi:hypothetical protein
VILNSTSSTSVHVLLMVLLLNLVHIEVPLDLNLVVPCVSGVVKPQTCPLYYLLGS